MSNRYVDKSVRDPFKEMVPKVAAMTIEGNTLEEIRDEIHEYIEAATPHLSPHVEEINFDNVDLGNGDIIGKVLCNINGEEIHIPLIVAERVIQPMNVGAYGNKMIPMTQEYLTKIIEGKSEIADFGVRKEPESDDVAAVFRFETEHELPTYSKSGMVQKVAQEFKIKFDDYRDKVIFGEDLLPKPKLASFKAENSKIPYHYDVVALMKNADGEYVIETKDEITAEQLRDLQKIAKERFGKIKPPEVINKIARGKNGELPDGFKYLSEVLEGRNILGPYSQITIYPYLEREYLRKMEDEGKTHHIGYLKGSYSVKDITPNIFDDDKVSALHLDSDGKDRLFFGFLTYKGAPEKMEDHEGCSITPGRAPLENIISDPGNKRYMSFVHQDGDNWFISMPYKIDGSYLMTLPTENNLKVKVRKLRKYVTDTNYCFIEGMGNEEIKELSAKRLREIGLYEGEQYKYYAIPAKYGYIFFDSVEYISDDINELYTENDITDSKPQGEDDKHEKVANLKVTYDPNIGVDVVVKGAGNDEKHEKINKEEADLYLDYYTDGELNMNNVKLGHEYVIEVAKPSRVITINNPYRGEWLKTAYWFKNNIDKHADIEELVDSMIGMEFLSDEVDSGNDLVAELLTQLPSIIDKVGRLLILSRVGRVGMSPATMQKVFEALGDLHCEIK